LVKDTVTKEINAILKILIKQVVDGPARLSSLENLRLNIKNHTLIHNFAISHFMQHLIAENKCTHYFCEETFSDNNYE
jgi:hypothetical protein